MTDYVPYRPGERVKVVYSGSIGTVVPDRPNQRQLDNDLTVAVALDDRRSMEHAERVLFFAPVELQPA